MDYKLRYEPRTVIHALEVASVDDPLRKKWGTSVRNGSAKEAEAAEWLSRLIAFDAAPAWDGWRTVANLRALVLELYEILSTTPDNLLQKFNDFDELALDASAKKLMCHMTAREKISDAWPAEDALFSASAVLRSLDELLKETVEYIPDEAPECWLSPNGEAYLIPIPRAVVLEGGPRSGQTFIRRGLLNHRVIPVRLGDVDIVVDMHPDLTCHGAHPGERMFGAALFLGFKLEYEERDGNKFVVRSVDCRGGIDSAVDRHCDDARNKGCDTVIWPELTMSPASVAQVQKSLARDSLRSSLPAVIVPGSWHVEIDGSYSNQASVLSGRGEELLQFGKNRLFSFAGLTEDVVVHGMVHILATDRELIAFAICKDFCDTAPKPMPVTTLDVDVVIVPSMGKYNTMTSHRDAADDMKVLFGARSAVVQQKYPLNEAGKEDDGAVGYVLKAPKEPRAAERANLVERTRFTTFQRER